MFVSPIGLQMSFGKKLFYLNCHNFFSSSVTGRKGGFLFGCQICQTNLHHWMSGTDSRCHCYGAGEVVFAARISVHSADIELYKSKWTVFERPFWLLRNQKSAKARQNILLRSPTFSIAGYVWSVSHEQCIEAQNKFTTSAAIHKSYFNSPLLNLLILT